MSTDNQRFGEQTTVDWIVDLALNTTDKPGRDWLGRDPAEAVGREIALHGVAPVERALVRCRELVDLNPRDFTAVRAVEFLEGVLAG